MNWLNMWAFLQVAGTILGTLDKWKLQEILKGGKK